MGPKKDSCPYRGLCDQACPGDDDEEGLWRPVDGFVLEEYGVHCEDWNWVIPMRRILKALGQKLQSEELTVEKISSVLGEAKRQAQKRYADKPKGKATQQKYYNGDSNKQRLALERTAARVYKEYTAWVILSENSGKSMEDFLKSQIVSEGGQSETE
jgi:hypothetical protein